MSVIKKARQIETFEISEPKIDLSILRKKSTGKTASGICLGYMRKLKNSGASLEFLKVLESMYKDIFNLETSERFRMEKWKSKSGIQFLIYPHKVICISYQRFEPGAEPKEIKTELTKEKINQVIGAINKLDEGKEIPTPLIAEKTYGKNWVKIFPERKTHILFTKILNYLEYRGDLHYFRSGKVKVLRKLNWY